MKLDKNICLGGRWNNKKVVGIKYGNYVIYPPFNSKELYNSYTLNYTRYPTGNYTTLIVEKECLVDYVLETDWGDGTIDSKNTHVYAEPGKYTIKSNGFLNAETDNGSRLIGQVRHIRPDVIDGSYLFYNFDVPNEDFYLPETSFMNNMSYMFYNCDDLVDEFDLSSFDTKNVEDMSYMFCNCDNVFDLIVRDWNVNKVTNMSHMFDNCNNILELLLNNWVTSSATDMSYMFYSCNRIQSLNIMNFDMTNVTNTENMFSGCVNLNRLALNNCSESTVRKIIESGSLPTSEGYGIRKMLINPNYVHVNNLTLPTSWKFYNCLTNEEII